MLFVFADVDFLLLVVFVGGCSTCLSVAVRSGFGLGAGLGGFGFRVLSVIGLCGLLTSLVGLVISCFLAFWLHCIILFCSCGLVV